MRGTEATRCRRPQRATYYLVIAVSLMTLTHCVGGMVDPESNLKSAQAAQTAAQAPSTTDKGAVTPPDHIPAASPCTSQAPAPRTLRRLTQNEYNATVHDLLTGQATVPQDTHIFTGDPAQYKFQSLQYNLTVNTSNISEVSTNADTIAAFAAKNPTSVSACNAVSDTCVSAFIGAFGKKAFRRPLSADEAQDYTSLVTGLTDFPSVVTTVVTAMMQAPQFLYRTETGAKQGTSYALTPYEVASELSYLITGSMPDAPLMQAADAGQLTTSVQILAQATRLLADPRAHAVVDNFFLQWLQIADLPDQVRTEDGNDMLMPAMAQAMQQEAAQTVDDIVFNSNGTFKDLLTANYSYVNPALATWYHAPAPNNPNFTKTVWQNGERLPGVIGLGGFLAAASQSNYASPVLRGRALRMRFLCGPIGSPPANVPQVSAATSPTGGTLRDKFSAHVGDPTCALCHNKMDPMAYPLADFDTVGRKRAGDMEAGGPVVLTGEIKNDAGGSDQMLAGPTDLIDDLATSPDAAACLARHWSMFSYGQLTWDQDSCTFDAVGQYAAKSQYNLKQMLLGITQAPSFTQRVMDP